MVNGKTYDFESLKIQLPTGLILGCESVEYGDEKGDEVITGMDNQPVGIGRGEWKGTCKLELQRFEYNKLNSYAKDSGGFYNMPPIAVIASYGNDGESPVTDSLMVHFTKRDYKGSKGDTNLVVTIEGAQTKQMNSDGVTAFVPYL
jgi:hypothetical protein